MEIDLERLRSAFPLLEPFLVGFGAYVKLACTHQEVQKARVVLSNPCHSIIASLFPFHHVVNIDEWPPEFGG